MRNKLCISILGLMCAGLIAPRAAFPIGRIGNAKLGDATDGYSVSVPEDFNQIVLVSKNSAVLQSSYLLDPELGLTVDIHASPFNMTFPQSISPRVGGVSERDSLLARLQEANDMNYQVVQTPNCSLSVIGENDSTIVGIVALGSGRGYVLSSPKIDASRQAILSIILSSEINTPCWK